MTAQAAPQAPTFNMNAAVTKLMALAANKREHRPRPAAEIGEGITISPFRLCTLSDYPEPTPEWEAADDALKAFADELAVIGGLDLMVEVYDETAERHGYRAVCGVSASWSGSHGWWH